MLRFLSILICGILFGLGLAVSELINPQKVIDFLDITGHWDPSLILVMVMAVLIMALTYRLTKLWSKPIIDEHFITPAKTNIDLPLISGALLFGIGWGLVGLCPGPALAGLVYLQTESMIFFASMIAGMIMTKALTAYLKR